MAIKYELSSGNVFADIGIENPEEALAKAKLITHIHDVIKKKKLTQKKAAILLGIDQPKVSALLCGKFSGFSLERLIRFLNALGADVTINVKTKLIIPIPILLNSAELFPNPASSNIRGA